MNEEFFHYLWRFRLLDHDLLTIEGEPLTIIHPGEPNPNSGPDFFNARIRIGDTTWAGNVEIHIHASDWYRHNHQVDRAYDNIILHAVAENDVPVIDPNGRSIPTLEMKGRFPESILSCYQDFQRNQRWIPCEQLIADLDQRHFSQWATALNLEFQEEKMNRFRISLEQCRNDWDECFYQQLLRSFGFRINAVPFELLAKSLPYKTIRKYEVDQFILEALLFGQAGFLERDFNEEYPAKLKKEYNFLRAKHALKPVNPALWSFLRLRPSNFPTLRIAELATLLHRKENLFELLLKDEISRIMGNLFMVATTNYWSTHFHFDKLSTPHPKFMGRASADLLILNFVVPFLFFYGEMKQDTSQKERAIQLLELLPGEMNSVIRKWKESGFPVKNALHTQALLHLKRSYCDSRQCLKCRIGNVLLRNGNK
jgi:hypothetical protein